MDKQQASITALISAYARVYHAANDTPKIFDDSLAGQLYAPGEIAGIEQNLAGLLRMVDPELAGANPSPTDALARVMQLQTGPITLSRSRYCEDCLEEAVRQGTRQYVILGAGFDTFAFRRPDLLEQIDVFEVDHPSTQALKRQRIAAAGWKIPGRLHFVALDFTKDRLTGVLLNSSYKPHRAAFFSWLGVSYYLERDVVLATLQAIACLARPGSQIVFDFLAADAFAPERAGKRVQLMQAIAQMVGEPMKTGFEPTALPGDLASTGFELIEELNPAAIETRFFQGRADEYHAFEQIHFARAVVGEE